jgi:hypothetical protein
MVLDEKILESFTEELKKVLLKSWTDQGHYMNGKIIDEVELRAEYAKDFTDIGIWILKYGSYLEVGVSKEKIPFNGITGRGGKSLYIEALTKYVMKRKGLEQKKALSMAFAIAYTQKREGMPTRGSYKYSNTGKRTEWINETMKNNVDLMQKFVADNFSQSVDIALENIILKEEIPINISA